MLALKPRTSILNRDTQMGHHREKNHGEGCMGMETETEVMWPQVKGCLEPPEAGKARKHPLTEPPEEDLTTSTP